jgi:hypothetical protein
MTLDELYYKLDNPCDTTDKKKHDIVPYVLGVIMIVAFVFSSVVLFSLLSKHDLWDRFSVPRRSTELAPGSY